nr:PREDICTED: membrane-associated guanylate kinase, WW and PDZ domain-containing protein 1-like [Latimeria chalumnae]|eukprot:XP_014339384.1 PREDICTED: membrane-associated guanylate kinase, WW and PDZ domain-containing protein 1-like [Latimeria chalumnae]
MVTLDDPTEDDRSAAGLTVPHRISEIRKGSPADRCGQLRVGDRLEGVEGRSIVNMPHREIADLFRRAGTRIHLRVIPWRRKSSSSLPEAADIDVEDSDSSSFPPQDSGYYSVVLDRGPVGFGISLRGGREYKMGLYILGLMDQGPAQRDGRIQPSDQVIEINGKETAGMSHAMAVEEIRRGGSRLHLLLKRGSGYVPDYGLEITDPPTFEREEGEQEASARFLQRDPSSIPKSKERSRGEQQGPRAGQHPTLEKKTASKERGGESRDPERTPQQQKRDPSQAQVRARRSEKAATGESKGERSRRTAGVSDRTLQKERARSHDVSEGREPIARRPSAEGVSPGERSESADKVSGAVECSPSPGVNFTSAARLSAGGRRSLKEENLENQEGAAPSSAAGGSVEPTLHDQKQFSLPAWREWRPDSQPSRSRIMSDPRTEYAEGARRPAESGESVGMQEARHRGTLSPGPWLVPSKERLLEALTLH